MCSSNICFVRSKDEDSYDDVLRKIDQEHCWEIHKFILSLVKPKFVICNGKKANDFFQSKMLIRDCHEIELNPNPQRKVCTLTEGEIISDEVSLKNVYLFSIPHLSRFSYYPQSALWIREKISRY